MENQDTLGGAKWPKANQNDYFSETDCPTDLKPSCKFKFFHCLEVYLKNDQFGPWKDLRRPFVGKGPQKSVSQGPF